MLRRARHHASPHHCISAPGEASPQAPRRVSGPETTACNPRRVVPAHFGRIQAGRRDSMRTRTSHQHRCGEPAPARAAVPRHDRCDGPAGWRRGMRRALAAGRPHRPLRRLYLPRGVASLVPPEPFGPPAPGVRARGARHATGPVATSPACRLQP
jgi:hypothetical protein